MLETGTHLPFLYQRVMLKISGEVLAGQKKDSNFDSHTLQRLALDIDHLVAGGVQVAIVVGGGNIFRGQDSNLSGVERSTADHMGMLATVMNALALQSTLEHHQMSSRVLSAIPMADICEPYIRRRAVRHLEKGRVVIFAAGTGSPYFTTDTAAALRASELHCDVLAKATKVDGIYDSDPYKNPEAQKLDVVSYDQVLNSNLSVMDTSAMAMCRDNSVPVLVFSLLDGDHPLSDAIRGQGGFSKVVKYDHQHQNR